MRKLDECRAEIFRLGEEKIKKRKKRRIRAISVYVPLCLCLIVWSVTVLPAMFPASMTDGNDKEIPITEYSDEALGTVLMKYAQVEINGIGGTEFYNEIKEPLKTNHIANLIEGFYANNIDGAVGGSFDVPISPNEKPENFEGGYLIAFSMENGSKAEYTFSGCTLKDESTGEIVILTETQRQQLLSELTGGV